MNILLINHYAGSTEMGMEFRPYYMAREWTKLGHKVDIIAGDYSHLRKVNPTVKHDFQTEDIEGITYHWIKTGTYEGNGARRAITMFRFVGKLWWNASKIVKKIHPDVVIASSTYPIDTFAAQRIAKKAKARLIHEVHDMWPISPMEIGHMSKYNPFIILMQIGENSFCKKSDRIVSLLPNAKDYFVKHGMTEKKFVCVPNGVIIEDWTQQVKDLPETHKKLFDALKKDNKIIIGFFGSHTRSYALEYLIDAVRELQNENVCVVFVGDGTDKEHLKVYAEGANDRIFFLPPVDKRVIPNLLDKMDILYVGALNNRMFRFGICMNKLFDSMMSGKPILYAVNAPNNYITKYHCGISVQPEDKEALKSGIEQLIGLSPEERKKMGDNGRKAVIENFEYSVLARKFLEVME